MKSASKNILSLLLILLLFLSIECQLTGEAPSETQTTPQTGPSLGLVTNPKSIDLLSTHVTTDFPISLTFGVKCEGESKIIDIELRYRIAKRRAATVCITPDFEPSRHIETSWTWDTRKASMPPGARVRYSWVVENIHGERLQTEWEELTFRDSRHVWHELSNDNIRMFWYRGDHQFGQELKEAAEEALNKLSKDVGAQFEEQARIYVYANSRDLRGALVFPQEWTGGVAFTDYGVIAIGISPGNLSWGKRALAHELTHLVIHQITFTPFCNLPTWLDEGLAVYAEGKLRADFQNAFSQAISRGNLISIQSLSGSFPANPEKARLAYAESYSIVKFLIDEYGSDRILELLKVFKEGRTTNQGLIEVYGFNSEGLNSRWQASLDLRSKQMNKRNIL